jgi:hypothetical protein
VHCCRLHAEARFSRVFQTGLRKTPGKYEFSRIENGINAVASLTPIRRDKMATDDKIQTIALSKIAAELAEKHEMSKKAAGEFLSAFV